MNHTSRTKHHNSDRFSRFWVERNCGDYISVVIYSTQEHAKAATRDHLDMAH